MAKLSFQSFNVAPGADPMGIGVPDYGRSSFDPVEFVRRAWDETKSARIMRDQEKKKAFEDFRDSLPSFEAWEQSSAQTLNQELQQITSDMYDEYSSGQYDPFAKDESGLAKGAKYNLRMKDLQNKMSIYKQIGEKYRANYNESIKPSNAENLDRGLTQSRFQQFMDEPDLQKKASMLAEGPLVVFKPKPIEVMDEMRQAFNMYIPGLDKEVTSEDFDPATQKLKVTTTEKMDPVKLERGLDKAWGVFSDRVREEWNRRYEQAPKSQKTALLDDGTEVPLDVKDWWKAQFSPEYAKRINVSYVAKSQDAAGSKTDFDWTTVLPGINQQTGKIDLSGFRETKSFGYKNPADPQGTKTDLQFNSEATIPLQGVLSKQFVMPNSINTRDTESGDLAPQSKSAANIADNISVLPIAHETTSFTDATGKSWTFQPGEMIPKNIQQQMDAKNMEALKAGKDIPYRYRYDAFLTTQVAYKQQATTMQLGDVELPMGISSFTNTTVRPWREAQKYVVEAAKKEKADLTPLVKRVDEILNQLNGDFEDIFKKASTSAEYDDLFGTQK